jgi:hypothetical protein
MGWPHGWAGHLCQAPTKNHPTLLYIAMQQQQDELPAPRESRLQLALQAIECDATLSQRRAAKIYRIPRSTLSTRRAGTTFIRDCTPKPTKLLKTEEEVIVQHILDLDARGFPSRLAAVADMANSLRAERHLGQVGVNWASTFVRRKPELKVKFNRKYNYKRTLCKDPQVIRDWFRLWRTRRQSTASWMKIPTILTSLAS